MTTKYSIHNQLTGLQEDADTFGGAIEIQTRLKQEWLKHYERLFIITILVQNEDGSWTQSVADENGNPII